jgi:acyl-CoA synthetase (AMP-forming)/AMP-acid ligase II
MLGEEVGAAVALPPGAQADAAAIRDFVKERIAGYKYPRRVWFRRRTAERPDRQDPQARHRRSRGGVMTKAPIGRRQAAHTGNHVDILPHIFPPA